MARIHLLDRSVSELIAAGEVVERPASIVKELIENSIDADATQITVEIKGGGIGYLRITDNGCGMEREDIPTAFLRHATSKVREAEDLEGIYTLGFRGEALASVAAVSRVEITTKTPDSEEGSVYRIAGEETDGPHPTGATDGTTLIIRDVFYNTPARMKFLRRDVAEGNAVAQAVDKSALSHPEIAFRFIRDTQTKLQTSGNGDLQAVIAAVYGRELAKSLLPVDYLFENRIHVSGFVGEPGNPKPTRAYQNFFINGRYVRTRTGGAALEEAFKGKLMTGRFPVCVLNLQLEPDLVDPNVHPAKIEVRFSDEKAVFNAVYFAVKSALREKDAPMEPPRKTEVTPLTLHLDQEEPIQQRLPTASIPIRMEEETPTFSGEIPFGSSRKDAPPQMSPQSHSGGTMHTPTYPAASPRDVEPFLEILSGKESPPASGVLDKEEPPQQLEDMRLIGELFGTYILLEQGEELVVVDKHAAHERILYEQIKERMDSESNRQVLLAPVPVTLSKEEYDILLANPQAMEGIGIAVEDFGSGTLIVRETPVHLAGEDLSFLLSELAGKLLENHRDLSPAALDSLLFSIACKSAVRAGDQNNAAELEEIIRRLRDNPEITHCPHGRPVSTRLSRRELEKLFGRLG